jgi:putative addiction module killer protein
VEARPRRIVHYVSPRGNAPFEDWMAAVRGSRIHAKILQRIDRIEDGNLGKYRSVGEGVCELVVEFGPGYRVYFGQDGHDIVLLCAGDKSTQDKDISEAKRYWRHYNAEEDEEPPRLAG